MEYVVAEIDRDRSREVRFFGYRLGTVRVAHRHGDSTITAYFAPEDEEGCSGYMLTHLVSEESQQIREDQDEYSFLGYYGIRLTHPLVWSPSDWGDDQPCDIPSIRGWFPSYEGWGIS